MHCIYLTCLRMLVVADIGSCHLEFKGALSYSHTCEELEHEKDWGENMILGEK